MKKGNKKLALVAVLLLLVTISFGTYAIYRTSSVGTGTVATANWHVEVAGTDVSSTAGTFTFSGSDVNWTTNTSAVNGKIAPGSQGTYSIALDATGSEVPVAYEVSSVSATIGGTAVSNDKFTVTIDPNDTGKLAYAATNMTKNIPLIITWTGSDSDTAAQDSADISMAGQNVTISVTLTVKQDLNPGN